MKRTKYDPDELYVVAFLFLGLIVFPLVWPLIRGGF